MPQRQTYMPGDEDCGVYVCVKCGGEGDVPGRRMGVITPDSEPSDRPGDFFICPHCGGTGKEP
jgi:hypothetical protein